MMFLFSLLLFPLYGISLVISFDLGINYQASHYNNDDQRYNFNKEDNNQILSFDIDRNREHVVKQLPDESKNEKLDTSDYISNNIRINDINTNDNTESNKNEYSYHAPHKHHKLINKTNHNQKNRKNTFNDDLIVNTENGYIRGRSFITENFTPKINKNKNNRKKYRVNAWLGIPYAEKPIGDLKFKRPVPVKNWNGILNATELPNSCYQLPDTVIPNFWGVEVWNANTNVSEDCLYLNIWTPHPKPKNSAVMVWIYGGSFYSGTSTLKIYDPKVFVAETQVIFVSLNYRLSIFGFLYMDHENAPGNQGLLDQYLALNWIHNNIQFFGGDNTKITLFGESAGSASVSLHLLSRLSANLFRNAILQSGSALADWTTLKNTIAVKRYKEILEVLGCNGTTTEAIECAKKIDPKVAIEKSDEHFFGLANHGIAQFPFLPVVDNYFLEDEPINLINRGKFKKCPVLLGVNKDEGNWFYVYAFSEYRNLTVEPQLDYDTFKTFLESLFHFYPQYPSRITQPILDAIIYRYTNWNNVHNTKKNIESLDDAAADFHFICPALDLAGVYSMNQQDVYFYYFTQRSTTHLWPEWLGVMHADEISFVFGEPLNTEYNFTESEKTFSRKLLKYWSNFARYSNPNGLVEKSKYENDFNNSQRIRPINITTPTLRQYIEPWPKYKISFNSNFDNQRAYLNLEASKIEVEYNLRTEYCSFWGFYLPNLMLSESRCHCNACMKNVEKSSSASHIRFSTSAYNKSFAKNLLLKLNSNKLIILLILIFLKFSYYET